MHLPTLLSSHRMHLAWFTAKTLLMSTPHTKDLRTTIFF